MKKIYIFFTALGFCLLAVYFLAKTGDNPREDGLSEGESEYSDSARIYQEFLMLRDPKTNRIPDNIYSLEQEFTKHMPKVSKSFLFKGSLLDNIQALTWAERGPNNIGGRVRALGIDIRTTTTPTLIAGGVSGGLWKSTDGGASWAKKTTASQLHSVTSVAQDVRSGSQDIWYAGSGEYLMNSASGWFSDYAGDGIFKSTDNGDSWTQLPATHTSDNTGWATQWQYVWRVAVSPTTGTVFAANTGGIYRSTDGGTSWSLALGHGNASVKSDVVVASNGTVYSAQNPSSGNNSAGKGIRKSTDDGATWTDISPSMPDDYGRLVIAVAPSDPQVVYFLMEGVSGSNTTPNLNGHMLYWTNNSGTAWTNITSFLPDNAASTTANIGLFSTQTGYDMMLTVKPDNSSFVIVGGTNLFRITDATNDNQTFAQKHIGGYGCVANGTSDAMSSFINHHSDTHYGVFVPGSNNKFYNATDGGVYLADDITAVSNSSFWQVKQTSLNVSQVYCLSLDKSAVGSPYIAAGFQDQGNWLSRTSGAKVNWQQVCGMDGAFTEISPNGTYVFQSTQRGDIFRFLKSDASSPITSYTSMKPSTLNNPMFINPFAIDPTDNNTLYFAGGNTTGSTSTGIYRSGNATESSPSWSYFTNSNVSGEQVSSIAVSTTNSANVLYFGTSGGKVFRLDNANSADPATASPVTITGAGFPAGFVRCIAVDPANSANVLVAFSNYNVDRLWYSTNSGTSWTSITGNLTGANSPSIRWAKIFTIGSIVHYFLAASTGIFYTTTLSGSSTVWTQEAETEIGNVVCTMLDYRSSDNTLVVGTHGRGIFETTLGSPLPVELISFAGIATNNGVELFWRTASEINNFGFEIQKSADKLNWAKIGFIPGKGNSNKPNNYSFTDKSPATGINYYRLKQQNFDGTSDFSSVCSVDFNIPSRYQLTQNYPNPFNSSTTIAYALPKSGDVHIRIFNLQGKKIADPLQGFEQAGYHKIRFDASNLASGIYYYELQAGNFREVKKFVLLK